MKKPYLMPMVEFEAYSLDMPIAANCDPDHIADARELEEMGWISAGFFNPNETCKEQVDYGDNKLCYYTVTYQLFTS